ncbi:MAG: DNA recombination protein RmuC [Bacteroidaceae bacterium]|nr:DNA recombination protein RmuC [Bacteroidaceae bacterium]
MNILLALILGMALGAALVGVLYFRQKSRHTEQLQIHATRIQILDAQIQADKQHYERTIALGEENHRQALEAQEVRFREAQTLAETSHRQVLEAQEARFQETIKRVTYEVKSATDEMLKQRQQEFSQSSTQNLGQIVTPLKETIEAMRKAMDNTNLKHTELSSAMKEQIQMLMRQTESARLSAEELARVFKHGSKVQGDWGETVLCELLDAHGLTCGVHYDTQTTLRDAQGNVLKTEQGSMLRPDVVLHLDGKREVIIDSKVSLTAFMDYVNAESDDERQRHLKLHIESLQKHVKELATKDYSSYICPPKVCMDYVIMFVPHSGALWTALNAQPDMWRRAMEKNVFIADEQTLFAALRIVSLTWTQIAQAENHEKVYTLANEMLDRVGQFMKKYQAMGKALENAQKAYEDGEKKLLPTGQSILQTCAKLQKLGAKQSTTNPLPQINDDSLAITD